MCIFHDWKQIGVYGEKEYDVLGCYYLRIYEGYVCNKCGASRRVQIRHYYEHKSDIGRIIKKYNELGVRNVIQYDFDVMNARNSK